MTSAPAIPRSATCAASRSIRSRSTARSSPISPTSPTMRRSCAPSSRWPTRSTSRSSPRGSKRPSNWHFCATERCDRVQGFYFSQAVPLATLESYIIRGTEADRRRVIEYRGNRQSLARPGRPGRPLPRRPGSQRRHLRLDRALGVLRRPDPAAPPVRLLRRPPAGRLLTSSCTSARCTARRSTPRLEKLFERGIDPGSIDARATVTAAADWPDRGDGATFRRGVRCGTDRRHRARDARRSRRTRCWSGRKRCSTFSSTSRCTTRRSPTSSIDCRCEAKHGPPSEVRDVTPKRRDPIAIPAGRATLGLAAR